MVLAEHNNRLPPVADKRRALWRRGQRKFALQAKFFLGTARVESAVRKSVIFERTAFPQGSVSTFSTRSKYYSDYKEVFLNCELAVSVKLFGDIEYALCAEAVTRISASRNTVDDFRLFREGIFQAY